MTKKYLKLSETLKKLLFEQDMRPMDLAKELNLPQPTIHRLVSGKSTRPYKSSLEPIAAYFNVSIEQLLGEERLYPDEHKTTPNRNINLIPVISWASLDVKDKWEVAEYELVAGNMGQQVFAAPLSDCSMEPAFQRGSILIFDPEITPDDRSYALVKLTHSNTYIFRQILIDADQKFIKSLNPDISANSIRLLSSHDEVVARLIEARHCFKPSLSGSNANISPLTHINSS